MSKKIILFVICIFIIALLFSLKIKNTHIVNSKPLLEFLEQSEINVDDIEKVTYVRYTEGGDSQLTYADKDDIESLYNKVKSIRIGKETNSACEDNTTVYIFYMKDGTNFKVEIECDWVVINDKRYKIVKN